jgi:hypothetical protein
VRSDRVHIQGVETTVSDHRGSQKRALCERIQGLQSAADAHMAEAKARDLVRASIAEMPIHRGKILAAAKKRDTWAEAMVLCNGLEDWEKRAETCAEAEAKEPGKGLVQAQCTSAEEMPHDTYCSGSWQQFAHTRESALENSKAACLSVYVRASRYHVFRSREALAQAS